MIFEIDSVELKFKGNSILSDIYLKTEVGKITGILGRNGTGKSSLLKVFFGSLQPQHKLVRVDKKAYLKPFFLSGLVKYLPQHLLLPHHVKIKEAFELYQVEWSEFTTAFQEFETYALAKVHQLSGGEIRVAEIYLSLKSPSKLVLLDEPFSHVAPIYIEKLKPVITIEKEKKAIIMTDHMYRHVIEMADEIYLLRNGSSILVQNIKDLENQKYLNRGTFL